MTQDEAQRILEEYINHEAFSYGHFTLPKYDIIIDMGANNKPFEDLTFRYLLKIAFDLKE